MHIDTHIVESKHIDMCVLTWIGYYVCFCTVNNIGAEGARDIAKALEHNSTLQHLNLQSVCISYACAIPQCHMISCIFTHTHI